MVNQSKLDCRVRNLKYGISNCDYMSWCAIQHASDNTCLTSHPLCRSGNALDL